MTLRLSLALALALVPIAAPAVTTDLPFRAYATLDGRKLPESAIAARVASLMAANNVTGIGIAVIRDGKTVFRQSYGYADREAKLPLTSATIMYAGSLTKATFAWMLMQLVDEGKVDLDKPIAAYLAKPLPDYPMYADLKGDDRWRRLTLRILMNHTSGFANLRFFEDDKKLRIHRDPGTRFGYSGEGIHLAQFVLEEGLGIDTGKEMQSRVFDRFRMNDSSVVWRDDYAGRFAYGYTDAGERVGFKRRKRADAIGSLDTTLTDWSRFLGGVVRGDGLSRAARSAMVRPTVMIDSATQFPTLSDARTGEWQPMRLGYAVGWGTFESRFGHAFFKEGHDDGIDNYAVCIDPRQSCILLLSNDNRAVRIFVPLVNELLGPIGLPAEWEGYRP